ncbi:hypothetical protein AMECASPLE_001164, partial [Ameca splendens]
GCAGRCLCSISNQPNDSCVISMLYDSGFGRGGDAVIGEECVEERTLYTALGGLSVDFFVSDVLVSTLTVWVLSVRKSKTMRQRGDVSQMLWSFSVSLLGMTVLNTELSINSSQV